MRQSDAQGNQAPVKGAKETPSAQPGPSFELYSWIAFEIAAGCPELVTAQEDLVRLHRSLAHEVIAVNPDVTASAQNRIVNQLLNDFEDLLYESLTGRGRAAMRATRSLFEHLVNLSTVLGDEGQAQRFMDHEPVALRYLYGLKLRPLKIMGGKTLRSADHQMKKGLRKFGPLAELAITTHGRQFRRSWASKNLSDRADDLGVTDDYDFYRVASAVMHGSAAGVVGSFAEIETGETVFRNGPALSLCPLAIAYGLRFTELALGLLGDTPAVVETQRVISTLRGHWVRYSELTAAIDQSLWPKGTPMYTFARVLVGGAVQWWVCDTERSQVTEVSEPSFDNEEARQNTLRSLEDLKDRNKAKGHGEPVTIGVHGARPQISPAARWRAASEILPQRPLYIGEPPVRFFDPPRKIDGVHDIQ